ncbi:unnamed protein product [Withania somnifera]
MARLPGISEITESLEDPASKMNEGAQKHHNLKPIKKYCIEDDINKLFEAIEIRNSSRGVNDVTSKCAMKRPMRSSPSCALGFERICISQASELSAMKKQLPKASRSSAVSDTGAVKRLYRAVVVEAKDPEHHDDGGIWNLVEPSLVPERSMVDSLDKSPESENVPVQEQCSFATHSCHLSAVKHEASQIQAENNALYHSTDGYEYLKKVSCQKTTELAHSSTGNCTDKVELVLDQMVPSVNEAPAAAIVADMEHKQDLNFVSCSSSFGAGNKVTNPTSNSPSPMKPVFRSKAFFKKKVLSSFTSCLNHSNGETNSDFSCSRSEFPCQTHEYASRNNEKEEDEESPDSCGPSSIEVSSFALKSFFAELGLSSSSCNKAKRILTKADERSRSKERGQMSQSSKGSIGDYSSTTSHSDESYLSSSNLRWEAIVCVQRQQGNIGLRHIKLHRKIGGGDIGNVYLSELIGTNCLFAVKVMDNDFLTTLEYLHLLGVVYRDLKPENVLVREDGHIMLSDFDLSLQCAANPTLVKSSSLVIEPPKKSSPCSANCIDPLCLHPSCQVFCFNPKFLSTAAKTRKLKADLAAQVSSLLQVVVEPTYARSNSFVGTHEYLAPAIIKGEGHSSAVDWCTFRIFLYELLYGRTPFKGPGNEDTLANVVSQLLQKEPVNRLGAVTGTAEIKQHPFFEGLNWALIRCSKPPEMPRSYELTNVVPDANRQNKERGKCQNELKNTGEDFEFDMF